MARTLVFLVLFVSLAAAESAAADLSVSRVAFNGSTASPILTLSRISKSLTGLQCDLDFDSKYLELSPSAGAAASGTGKSMYVSSPAPGKVKLLFTGGDRIGMRDGVLAVLKFNLKTVPGAPPEFPVKLSNALGAKADGSSVVLSTADGSLSLSSSR
jgi:hypothetical protein